MGLLIVLIAFLVVAIVGWLFGADSRPTAWEHPQQTWPFRPRPH